MRKNLELNRHAPVQLQLQTATNQQFVYCSDVPDESNEEEPCQLSAKQKSAKSKSKVEKSKVESLKREVEKLQTQITMMKT